jgi:hypothetical protein
MKRSPISFQTTTRRTAGAVSSGLLLATQAMAQAPAKMASPAPASSSGQRTASATHIKYHETFKFKGELTCPGMLKGAPVFKNTKGEYFTVDPNTGDLKFHTAESLGYMKHKGESSTARSVDMFIKFDGIKGEQRVTLEGVDAQGRVLQKNSRGEVFWLGPNGDMMFVK